MIEVKIDKDGKLWRLRRATLQGQFCPFTVDEACYCGDWCPLFSEPIFDEDTVLIRICHKKEHVCHKDSFKDERCGDD